jgi:hypothetical protein
VIERRSKMDMVDKFSEFEYEESKDKIEIEIEGFIFIIDKIKESFEIKNINEEFVCEIDVKNDRDDSTITTIKIIKKPEPTDINIDIFYEIGLLTDYYNDDFAVVLREIFPNGGAWKQIYKKKKEIN